MKLSEVLTKKRKETKLTPSDKVNILYHTDDEMLKITFEEHSDKIKQSVLAEKLRASDKADEEIKIGDKKIQISILKICS